VLFIALLGASSNPAFSQEAGETESQQLNEDRGETRLAENANIGIELLTNRRKPLTASSSLMDITGEDVVATHKETRLVIMSATASVDKDEVGLSSAIPASLALGRYVSDPTYGCDPDIGLSYKDSTPCWPEVARPPKGSPNVVFIVLDDVGFGQIGCFGGPIETDLFWSDLKHRPLRMCFDRSAIFSLVHHTAFSAVHNDAPFSVRRSK